jgi:hypothetical protein
MANALKRRGSRAIRFDPGMAWAALPTGRRGRQPVCTDAAVQTCLTMKGEGRPEIRPVDGFQPRTGGAPGRFGMVDFGGPLVRATMSTRQTTGFVESLLRLVGLDGDVPDFSTLGRRRKTHVVNIPHRVSQGPPHLSIDIEPASATGSSEPARGIKGEGEAEWKAREHGGTERRARHCP